MTDLMHSISDVERDTGLAKETLRVWERRYGFPQPLRDAFGERVYPAEQMHKLRLMKRLLDLGYRPGKIVHHEIDALLNLSTVAHKPSIVVDRLDTSDLQSYLDLCKGHQVSALRAQLVTACNQLGLQRFVQELVGPLTAAVGEAWASGQLAIFEEHLYTESLQIVMRQAIATQTHSTDPALNRPRILLTTLPQERHSLGLLMAEALFALNGAVCISLGVQTPVAEIVDAARSQHADIVALSFSRAMNPRHVIDGLTALRQRLPPAIQIWVGGHCPVLAKRPPTGMMILGLEDVAQTVANWRRLNLAITSVIAQW